jgi:hypothetical protein
MTALTMGIGQERAIKEKEAKSGASSALNDMKDKPLPLRPFQGEQQSAQDAG